jgi:hypothetical protein
MSSNSSFLEEALARYRTRSSWNDRLIHWERPASDSEEASIQRAANVAIQIVKKNMTLTRESVQILPQGSYFNNTNVRKEADMDLRVQLPDLVVKYAHDVEQDRAYRAGEYFDTGRPLINVINSIRNEIVADCRQYFGGNSVTVGKKAITVDGLSGSRADVDLVPAFRLHWLTNNLHGGYNCTEGIIIVAADGRQTINFPDQHHANGKEKRTRTQHRFKKIVRMLKRLNYELEEYGLIPKRIPSFMVECLVYAVEDDHFLQNEGRYDRLLRIVRSIQNMLYDTTWIANATEINEIKFLFHSEQTWTLDQARAFVFAARTRLEA